MKWIFCMVTLVVFCSHSLLAQDATIRPGDEVQIRLGGVPGDESAQVTGPYQVDEQGDITMPHLGKVRAAGLTHSGLQSSIENAYKSRGIYTQPTITISIASSARFFNVDGAVRNRGRHPYTPDLTVSKAIAAAGGFTEFANQTKVQVTRGEQKFTINFRNLRNRPELDIEIRPGDIIFVPESLGIPFFD